MTQRFAVPRLLLTLSLLLPLLAASPADAKPPRKHPSHPAAQAADAPPHPLTDDVDRAELARFAGELSASQGWDLKDVLPALEQAQLVPAVQRLIQPPPAGTAKNWSAYRALFIEPKRIAAGVEFWQANRAAFARAEAQYGVPAEVVAGVLGVETFYGRIMGRFRVIDALATLSFAYPSTPAGIKDRSPFFREQLGELFKLARREGRDPASYLGSYAGAMGLPQFMPGSWNQHAVDFDGDGHIDLINDPVDAIGSVAHYLAEYGWQRGMTTDYHLALPIDTSTRARLLAPDVRPSFTVAELTAAGARLSPAAQEHAGLLAVIELQNGDAAPSYVLGTDNFYVITRYNHSSYYAMAVIELGRAVRRAVDQSGSPAASSAPSIAASGANAQ
ncbi:MAG: lytic murein transglycosylase B [Paucibacter sp.]|nr:lytic murein transglycosylase B [Roseateles sp.]